MCLFKSLYVNECMSISQFNIFSLRTCRKYMHATSLCNILCACVCVCITGILTQHLSLRFDDKTRDRTKLHLLSLLYAFILSSSHLFQLNVQWTIYSPLPRRPFLLSLILRHTTQIFQGISRTSNSDSPETSHSAHIVQHTPHLCTISDQALTLKYGEIL